MLARYKTVAKEGTDELIEKKSRFIGYAAPVNNEEEALAKLERIRKKYYDASHNVFAYVIGERNETMRQSDDGEPGGTAGLPVLDVLRTENLKNTLVVVTRYFGGTLLGSGGLVRAYGKTAKQAVSAAGIIEMVLCQSISVQVDYTISGKLEYFALQNGYYIYDTVYAEHVTFKLYIESERVEWFLNSVTDLTNGRAVIRQEEFIYHNFAEISR